VKEIRFTRHAFIRVHERLGLPVQDVATILQTKRTLPLGHEVGTTRGHELFFSAPDNQCFVAVVDENDGTVITILPLDYHETLGWKVSEDAQLMARGCFTTDFATEATAEVASLPLFYLRAHLELPDGQLRIVNLGTWPSEAYSGNMAKLFEDDSFVAEVKRRIARKCDSGNLHCILVCCLGKKGTRVRLSLTTDDEMANEVPEDTPGKSGDSHH